MADLRPYDHSFRFELWNSQGVVFSQFIPKGACTDLGQSCSFRDSDASRNSGLATFKVLDDTYQRDADGNIIGRGHGNKFWVESYGMASHATEAQMDIVIFMDDVMWTRTGMVTFTSKRGGWWWELP